MNPRQHKPREGTSRYPTKDGEDTSRRRPTLYDAVAGRISSKGFIPKQTIISADRDQASSSTTAIPPEAALFRSKSAPTRYAECDIYFANEQTLSTNLPESDLLKALHSYTSAFYSRTAEDGGKVDWRSMDDTALLALGILMEESSREILGETGDLALTEGEEAIVQPMALAASSADRSRSKNYKRRRISVEY